MTDQVLSIEQMQELIELGIDTSKASIHWRRCMNYVTGKLNSGTLMIGSSIGTYPSLEFIPTFTLQDILEMLPDSIKFKKKKIGVYHLEVIPLDKRIGGVLFVYKCDTDHTIAVKFDGSYLETSFEMLKWCKQNGYI